MITVQVAASGVRAVDISNEVLPDEQTIPVGSPTRLTVTIYSPRIRISHSTEVGHSDVISQYGHSYLGNGEAIW